MSLLKAATVFIGWLSGSLAGIGALLYGFGYLVKVAHLNVLGLDALLVSSNERFVQAGARFVIVTAAEALPMLLGVLVVGLAVAGPVVLIRALLSRFRPAALERLRARRGRLEAALAAAHRHLPWPPDVSLYLILLALLFAHLLAFLGDFQPPLRVGDLLYDAGAAAAPADPAVARLRCWLLTGRRDALWGQFSGLLVGELLAVAYLALAWHVTRARPRQALLVAPFLGVLALYTVYLPLAYGVLAHPLTYNRVRIAADGAAGGRLFLLQKTADEFVLWDADRRAVLWLPRGQVARAEVERAAPLFSGVTCDD